MELGPFETKMHPFTCDINGTDVLDIYPELEDDIIKLYRLDLGGEVEPSGERSVSNPDLKIKWKANLATNKSGIVGIYARVLGLTGTIEIEDIPFGTDPKDPDIEMETFIHSIKITEENIEHWKITVSYDEKTELSNTKEPSHLTLDFKAKTLHVEF